MVMPDGDALSAPTADGERSSRWQAHDLLYARIATHLVKAEYLEDVKDRLASLEAPPEKMHESVRCCAWEQQGNRHNDVCTLGA